MFLGLVGERKTGWINLWLADLEDLMNELSVAILICLLLQSEKKA